MLPTIGYTRLKESLRFILGEAIRRLVELGLKAKPKV